MTEQDKVTVDDIIGIVKTEEQTNSVEEVRKLRGRENKTAKRFTILYGVDENPFEWDIMDNNNDALICRCNGKPICDLLNELAEENEQLKKECYGNLDGLNYYQEQNGHLSSKISDLECENEQLKCSNKDAWDLIQFIYNEIKEDGSMDFGRIKDLVELE